MDTFMQRRHFAQHLALRTATAGLGLGLLHNALAQGSAPVEGQHYVRLGTPVAVTLPAGKAVEVVEFFWYGCPHCFAFEPTLENWIKRLPTDVHFRRVPAGFTATYQLHQKVFYALEEMGVLEANHGKLFNAIHVQNKRLNTEADVTAYLASVGVDSTAFSAAMKSFGVSTKANRAKQLSESYKIDGVPAIGVQGRFYTSVGAAGGPDRAIAVTDFLIQRARQKA
jgi:protein dithiol oxidoreductase (disulfide-forming)